MLSALRKSRHLIVLALLGAVVGPTGAASRPAAVERRATPASEHEYSQVHMGLRVRIRLYASTTAAAEQSARAAFARIARLDQMMSDYRPDSELRRLEGNGNVWAAVSPELFDVVQRAVEIARASDGAFDPSVAPLVALWRDARASGRLPDRSATESARARVGWTHIQLDASRRAIRFARPGMRLDLGGIAKGAILQDAVRALRAQGIASALVEAGGDIVVGDAPPGRRGWTIEAAGASSTVQRRAAALTNAALATSGSSAQFVEIDGIRYSHIVDPRTGVGLTHQLTAYVISPDAATADALATALSVAGPGKARALIARFPGTLASLTPPH
jgi:FAD:protein FMN transferase